MDRLLSERQLTDALGVCRLTLYRRMTRGDFPKPLQIAPQRVRWRESEVLAWLDNLPRAGIRSGIADAKAQKATA